MVINLCWTRIPLLYFHARGGEDWKWTLEVFAALRTFRFDYEYDIEYKLISYPDILSSEETSGKIGHILSI